MVAVCRFGHTENSDARTTVRLLAPSKVAPRVAGRRIGGESPGDARAARVLTRRARRAGGRLGRTARRSAVAVRFNDDPRRARRRESTARDGDVVVVVVER